MDRVPPAGDRPEVQRASLAPSRSGGVESKATKGGKAGGIMYTVYSKGGRKRGVRGLMQGLRRVRNALSRGCRKGGQDEQGKRGPAGAGGGRGAQYQRMFDPGTVETLAGEVTSVARMVPRKGMSSGIHLQLKTETGTLPVHLGPAWYIERLGIKIVKGDKLEIKGSRVTVEGKPAS